MEETRDGRRTRVRHRGRRLLALAATCAGLAAGALVPDAGATDAPRRPQSVAVASFARLASPAAVAVGIAAGGDLQDWPVDQLDRELDDYVALHARWLRQDFAWDAVEPAPGVFAWDGFDRLVREADRRRISVIATLSYSPAWANGGHADHRYAPLSASAFAAYAGAVAARYAPAGVHAYEIWNEPNAGYWLPRPSPGAYVKVLCAAYAAIHAADPTAVVISGGMSPAGDGPSTFAPHTWLAAMYADGAKPCFDAIGFHPYVDADSGVSSTDPGNPWFQMAGSVPSIRSIQAANDDSAKKIWATEVGCRIALGATEQATRLTATLARWRTYPWAGVLTWFTYWDPDQYGLRTGSWGRRPAWYAFRDQALQY